MSILVSLLVAIIGAFGYYAATKVETKELCRIAFGCGLLAFLIRFGMEALSFLGK